MILNFSVSPNLKVNVFEAASSIVHVSEPAPRLTPENVGVFVVAKEVA